MSANDWALHDARWYAAHGEWPRMTDDPAHAEGRKLADEIVRGLMARGVAAFCAHQFAVVRGEGHHA
jgi:hypothetical protein